VAARLRLEALEDRCLLSFSPAVNYPAGSYPWADVAADFNNDGHLDVALINTLGDYAVSTLLGNGNGTFQSAQSSPAGTWPGSLAAGDFNADGKLDLVTNNNFANSVSVQLGNGNGTFQAPSTIDLPVSAVSVAVGDFNGDGKLDIGAVGAYGYCCSYYGGGWVDSEAVVLLGTGTGTFLAPNESVLSGGNPNSAVVADFDGDGRLDFATTSEVTAPDGTFWFVDVALGDGTGSFNSRSSYSIGAAGYIAAGDVNMDGKADLVVEDSTDTVNVLLGDGLGSFASAGSYSTGPSPQSLALGDFNADGKFDLITTNYYLGTTSVLLGTGSGGFKPPVNAAVGSSPWGAAVGDFNGDGRLDAVVTNFHSGNVSVLLNDGAWPPLGAPSISINDVTVTEGNSGTTSANFTVSLSAAPTQTVSVHYATVDGSATTAGGDYQAIAGTLTFSPGVPSQTVTVLVNGDRLGESNESFLLLLTNPTNAFVADMTGVGSIVDDEPHVSIDDGPVSVTEGNTGTTSAVFTVRLSSAYDAPVSVTYATSDGSATTAGGDYQAKSDSVTFAAGQTSQTITVLVNGDRLGEYDEYFYVNLTGANGALIVNGTGYGTIVDDEPRVSIGSATVTEGNTGTTAMTFTVALSVAYDQPVTVTYATSDGSATTAGGDYQAKSDSVTFAVGQTSQTITVLVNGDRLVEDDEYFYVSLTGASGGLIVNSTGYGTILDNEPRLRINSKSIKEGNSGTKAMTFTVTLSAAYDQPVTVKYATHDDSATVADNDYIATSGTLTFAPGETSKAITVLIKGDTKKEADESFYVLLSDASSNALIDDAYGWGTIVNDDGSKGRNQRSLGSAAVGNSSVDGQMDAALSAAHDLPVSVNFAVHDDLATGADNDYVATAGTLTFAPGQTSKTITVLIKGDKKREANGSFYVLLRGASSNAQIDKAYGWGTIVNDDGSKGRNQRRPGIFAN
jgi:hypothetical protein